jgi:hypothetical protein
MPIIFVFYSLKIYEILASNFETEKVINNNNNNKII